MDILSYLSELLQTRKTIGIAGLGTLYKKKTPGRYDIETHSFFPPVYTLNFTSEMREEVILPNYISKNRGVSTDTSNYFIGEFSATILNELHDKHEASLGNLGKFIIVNNEIKFEPGDQANYGFDFYGLPAVSAEETQVQETPAEEILPEIPLAEDTPLHVEHVWEIPARGDEHQQNEPLHDQLLHKEPIQETPSIEDSATVQTEKDISDTAPVVENSAPAHTEENLSNTTPVIEEVAPVIEEPTIAAVVADNTSQEENPGAEETAVQKEEARLRAEIDALNFYRSKAADEKPHTPEALDVIEKLTDPVAEKEVPVKVVKYEDMQPANHFHAEKEVKPSPPYIKVILCLIIFILMLTAAYFVNPEWFKEFTTESFTVNKPAKSPAPKSVPTHPDSANVVTDSTMKTTAPAKQPAVSGVKDSVKSKVTAQPVDTATVYEIIGAAMHDQKEADNFIALMAKSGVKAKVVTNMPGRKLKISLATLKDEKSAQEELSKLKEKLHIPEIYIYRNKQR